MRFIKRNAELAALKQKSGLSCLGPGRAIVL